MTLEQRTYILRGLKKHSPVKYIGQTIKRFTDGQFEPLLFTNTNGFKLYNARGKRQTQMAVSIKGGQTWFLSYSDLTCKAIEVIERLEQSTQNTKQ